MTQPSSLPQPGALLAGKYRVERVLGRGGMGIVYAAQHELLCQRVAVKLLLTETSQSQEGLQRFLNEARAAARLDSEHVARVMDVGALEGGLPFMVLEYLEGQDLSQVLQTRGPLPVAEVVDAALQACEALSQAHAAGIVHRDLKPSNLYVARRPDGTSRVKVLDFGISKVSDHSLTPKSLTSTSSMLGTPYYMSPEQFASPKNVGLRTDIWQLGVTIYELLAGNPPFNGETLGQLIFTIMNEPMPSLVEKRPDVPMGLEQVIRRCLERDVARRFPDVGELAEALAPFGSGAQTHLIGRMSHTLRAQRGAAPPAGPSATARIGEHASGAAFQAPIASARSSGMQPPRTPAPSGEGQWGNISAGRPPGAQTSNAWQASGAPIPRSKAPIAVAISVVGVLAIGGGVLLAMRPHGHGGSGNGGNGTATVTPPPPPPPTVTPTATAVVQPIVLPPLPEGQATTVDAGSSLASGPDAGTPKRPAWLGQVPHPATTAAATATARPTATATATATHAPDQLPDNSRQ